jgi:hypothetical protein
VAKTRTKKSKQPYLPGLEPPSIPEIDAAAEAYYELKSDRQRLLGEEVAAKKNLIEKMLAHKQTRYVTPDDLVCDLLSKSNIAVKKKKDTPTEANGEE